MSAVARPWWCTPGVRYVQGANRGFRWCFPPEVDTSISESVLGWLRLPHKGRGSSLEPVRWLVLAHFKWSTNMIHILSRPSTILHLRRPLHWHGLLCRSLVSTCRFSPHRTELINGPPPSLPDWSCKCHRCGCLDHQGLRPSKSAGSDLHSWLHRHMIQP